MKNNELLTSNCYILFTSLWLASSIYCVLLQAAYSGFIRAFSALVMRQQIRVWQNLWSRKHIDREGFPVQA